MSDFIDMRPDAEFRAREIIEEYDRQPSEIDTFVTLYEMIEKGLEQAYRDGLSAASDAAAERAAIVAWLRASPGGRNERRAWERAARAIERGDHANGGTDDPA